MRMIVRKRKSEEICGLVSRLHLFHPRAAKESTIGSHYRAGYSNVVMDSNGFLRAVVQEITEKGRGMQEGAVRSEPDIRRDR